MSDMSPSYSEVIERMKTAAELKNDSAVARALGVTPQALSNYRKRGKMPANLVVRFAMMYGLSVDWLLTGEGEMTGIGYREEEFADVKNVGPLSPEEVIYVGKLLKILRGREGSFALLVKSCVDTLRATLKD